MQDSSESSTSQLKQIFCVSQESHAVAVLMLHIKIIENNVLTNTDVTLRYIVTCLKSSHVANKCI